MAVSDETDAWTPRRNPHLTGHQAAETALLQAVASGRLPHAMLFCGAAGIGKATLAYRFARWLLAQPAEEPGPSLFGDAPPPPRDLAVDPEHPAARRMAAEAHGDLLTIEREWDPKRKRLRGEITVENVREVANFLHLTSAEGGWRIVIVDGAEEMNRSAANALLKILEEPPRQALLLLVSHAPGQLLPTIRSRCRRLELQPLAAGEVVALLAQYRPEIAATDAEILANLADGSVGRAIDLADAGGLTLYRALLAVIDTLPRLDIALLHRLADQLARGEDDAYRTAIDLLLDFLVRLVAGGAAQEPRAAIAGEAALMARLAGQAPLDRWIEVWEKLGTLFRRADAVNLDRKQVILDAFFTMADAVR